MEIEEGSKCKCGGTFEVRYNHNLSCQCSISPPCIRCTSGWLECDECGITAGEYLETLKDEVKGMDIEQAIARIEDLNKRIESSSKLAKLLHNDDLKKVGVEVHFSKGDGTAYQGSFIVGGSVAREMIGALGEVIESRIKERDRLLKVIEAANAMLAGMAIKEGEDT